jgi:TorA maturation chaperone TorD
MSTWVFKCLQDLDKYAFHPFYKEMARLTQKFLAVEKDHLEKLVERSISDEGNKGVDMG